MSAMSAMWRAKMSAKAIERISPTGANPEEAILCPWFNSSEWEQVYEWLYSSDPQLVKRGIARVAAWKARAPRKLPLVVETTADLAECTLNERLSKMCVAHGICLSYSMAITRFVNGINDTARSYGVGRNCIRDTVYQYGIPSWLVELRHSGTHHFLPSIGQVRTAAQFALNWLRSNYWRPQRKLIREHRGKSLTPTPTVSTPPNNAAVTERKPSNGPMDSAVAKLTFGLCRNRSELVDLLTTSTHKELAGYIQRRQLLCFPSTVNITVDGPAVSDLRNLPSIKGDLAMWRKHLLRAADKESSFKHKLASALMMAHSTDNAVQRDYSASWLGLLLVEHYEVDSAKPSNVAIVTIVADDDQFIPGSLDWLQLLRVVKDHPGYYTHAMSTLIDGHLRSSLPLSVREKILYLSRLVTISERMGPPSLPGTLEGSYTAHLKATLKTYKRKSEPSISEPPRKQSRLSVQPRWGVVENMLPWVTVPLGACPGQVMTASCLDLPSSVNIQRERVKKQRKMDIKSESQGIKEEDQPTIKLLHARDTVRLF